MPGASIRRKTHHFLRFQIYSPQTQQAQLLKSKRRLQQGFLRFFFNLSDVSAGNGFTVKNFFGRTNYAQRKCCLWKNGGKAFPIVHREGTEGITDL
jgi:hypothetical protein